MAGTRDMSEEAFPITWTPEGYTSPIIRHVIDGTPW